MKTEWGKRAVAACCAFCLAGCQIAIDEKDIFKPEWAGSTTFTIETDDGPIFEHNRPRPGLFEEMGVSFEATTIPSDAGAIYLRIARGPDPGKPLIIYCGGNTWDIPSHGDITSWSVAPFGDAALWDYPGFGRSEGKPSVANFERAAEAISSAIERLKRSPDQKVIYWGQSLGGFVCADMAAKAKHADALVLVTTAPTAKAAARYLAPWYLRPFIRVRLAPEVAQYDNIAALDGFNAPMLVIGAQKDEVLPVKLSRELRDELMANGHRVTYAEFPKADHFTIIRQEDLGPVIRSFLDELPARGE